MSPQPSTIAVAPGIEIPTSELEIIASRSSGPGGQHVNKVETRVTLAFDLAGSPSLSDEQKARIRERLAGRVTKAGILRVMAQRHRSQMANRKLAMERFALLLRDALAEEAPRRPTKVPKQAVRRRLVEKRRRADLKRLRSPGADTED